MPHFRKSFILPTFTVAIVSFGLGAISALGIFSIRARNVRLGLSNETSKLREDLQRCYYDQGKILKQTTTTFPVTGLPVSSQLLTNSEVEVREWVYQDQTFKQYIILMPLEENMRETRIEIWDYRNTKHVYFEENSISAIPIQYYKNDHKIIQNLSKPKAGIYWYGTDELYQHNYFSSKQLSSIHTIFIHITGYSGGSNPLSSPAKQQIENIAKSIFY